MKPFLALQPKKRSFPPDMQILSFESRRNFGTDTVFREVNINKRTNNVSFVIMVEINGEPVLAVHDVEMTSNRRRCDVKTSHRRW